MSDVELNSKAGLLAYTFRTFANRKAVGISSKVIICQSLKNDVSFVEG